MICIQQIIPLCILLTSLHILILSQPPNKPNLTQNTRYDLVFVLDKPVPTNLSSRYFYNPIDKLRQDLKKNLTNTNETQNSSTLSMTSVTKSSFQNSKIRLPKTSTDEKQNVRDENNTTNRQIEINKSVNNQKLNNSPQQTIKQNQKQGVIKQNMVNLPLSNNPPQQLPIRQIVLQNAISELKSSDALIPFSKLFQRVLKPEQFERILSEADILPLVKAIQQILGSEMFCQEKTSRLSDYFGRIQTSILVKTYQNKKIVEVTSQIQKQVIYLQAQITQLSTNINNLQYEQARDRYIFNAKQLLTSYTIKNQAVREQRQKKSQLQRINSNLSAVSQKSQNTKEKISLLNLKLVQINYNITNFNQIQLLPYKTIISDDLLRLKLDDSKNNMSLTELQKSKNISEDQLAKIQKDIDDRTKQNNKYQADVQKLKDQLAEMANNIKIYKEKIQEIREKMKLLQSRVSYQKYYSNQMIITDLSKIAPAIHQRIAQQNYKCNKIKRPQSLIFNNQISFTVSSKDFASYLQSSYNATVNLYTLPALRTQIYPMTIQTNAWTQKFGPAYNEQSYSKAKNFYYGEDFNCLSMDRLQTVSGRITAINRKFMIIENRGKVQVNMGACTHIQSIQKLPRVGQQVYLRGYKIQQIEYNAYKISCF